MRSSNVLTPTTVVLRRLTEAEASAEQRASVLSMSWWAESCKAVADAMRLCASGSTSAALQASSRRMKERRGVRGLECCGQRDIVAAVAAVRAA